VEKRNEPNEADLAKSESKVEERMNHDEATLCEDSGTVERSLEVYLDVCQRLFNHVAGSESE